MLVTFKFPFLAIRKHEGSSLKIIQFLIIVIFLCIGAQLSGASVSPFLTREGDRVRGNHDAPITLIEYSDFTCGYCEKFFHETWPLLFSEYIQNGKVRLIYRDFPRALTGPSLDTALAARCAGEQGKYWSMHDQLFSSSNKYGAGPLEQQAKQLGLSMKRFSECFQSGRYLEAIMYDLQEGKNLGVRGTPGFILLLTHDIEHGEKMFLPGAFPYEVFKEEIDRLLEKVFSNTLHSPL